MKITPVDIQRQTFKKTMRGYDVAEVTNYLEMLSSEFEEISSERDVLKKKVADQSAEMERFVKMEKALQNALIVAQQSVEDAKENSAKESEIIIKEAKLKAEDLINQSYKDLKEVKKEIEQLKEQKKSFMVKFKNLLNSQLEMLGVLDEPDNTELEKKEYQPEPIIRDNQNIDLHEDNNLPEENMKFAEQEQDKSVGKDDDSKSEPKFHTDNFSAEI